MNDQSRPAAAAVEHQPLPWHLAPGEIRANAGLATLTPSGSLSVFNNDGTTDVAIDAFGYFTPAATG